MGDPSGGNTEIRASIEKLAWHCDDEIDLETARLSDEYFYQSIPLCIIDSVYSIGVKYESTRNAVIRYCDYYSLRRIRKDRTSVPARVAQESVGEFLDKLESAGIPFFVEKVFRNSQRTSTRSGILKGEAVLRFALCLHRYGVDCFQDVHKVIHDERFEIEIKSIPGQGSGISLAYFFMLMGSDDLVKPDRWIISFIRNVLGVRCPPSYAQKLLAGSCEILKATYPHLSPRLLDNAIWNYQKNGRKKEDQSNRPSVCGRRNRRLTMADSNIGPFDRREIVLCSADARSQKSHRDAAANFFPAARWIRAIGNSAERQHCRFVILTTAHGMVNPHDLISPYNRHICDHEALVRRKWQETIPTLLGRKGYRIIVFYSGGCPRDLYLDVMFPILHDLGIDLFSFGQPNMRDIGKTDGMVEQLIHGTSQRTLRSLLKYPERLIYYPSTESGMIHDTLFEEKRGENETPR